MFGILDIPKMLGAAVIAAGLTYAIVAPAQYLKGRAAGKAEIVAVVTKQNANAAAAARQARNSIDACDEANGTWNQESGRCDQ